MIVRVALGMLMILPRWGAPTDIRCARAKCDVSCVEETSLPLCEKEGEWHPAISYIDYGAGDKKRHVL